MNEMFILNKQKSQSGQALVEYVLLLVVAIALILGLAGQLYKPFSSWMKNYMGEYVECLLDVGELPTMGGGTVSGTCSSKFQSYTVKNGWPRVSSKGIGSQDDRSDDSNRSSHGSNSTETNSSSGHSSQSESGRSRKTAIGANTGADGPNSGHSGKQLTEPVSGSEYMKLKTSNSSTFSSENHSTESGRKIVIPAGKEIGEKKKERSIKVASEDDSHTSSKGKKLLIPAEERKVASETDDQPWSFGQYIKIALIIVIIVAIVLFLGGQILQISKGMEK
jgi:hypothetical protein